MTTSRFFAVKWYASLVAGVLLPLVLGFLASALANRLIFLPWAVLVAAAHAGLLALGWRAPGPRSRAAGLVLLLQGAGWGVFGWLLGRHQEILDLGFRAFLPALYAPALTRPSWPWGLGAILALGGLVLLLGSLLRRRSRDL